MGERERGRGETERGGQRHERETERETGRGRQGEVGEINLLELFCVQTLGFLLYSKTKANIDLYWLW